MEEKSGVLAKAAIDVLRTELSEVLNEGGIKHPQQAEWDVMIDEVRKLREQAKHVPMLVGVLRELVAVKEIKDNHGKCEEYLRRVTPAWKAAQGALAQLPEELRNGETHPSDNIPFNCENGDGE